MTSSDASGNDSRGRMARERVSGGRERLGRVCAMDDGHTFWWRFPHVWIESLLTPIFLLLVAP